MYTDNKLRLPERGCVGGDWEGGDDDLIPANPAGKTFRLRDVSV